MQRHAWVTPQKKPSGRRSAGSPQQEVGFPPGGGHSGLGLPAGDPPGAIWDLMPQKLPVGSIWRREDGSIQAAGAPAQQNHLDPFSSRPLLPLLLQIFSSKPPFPLLQASFSPSPNHQERLCPTKPHSPLLQGACTNISARRQLCHPCCFPAAPAFAK